MGLFGFTHSPLIRMVLAPSKLWINNDDDGTGVGADNVPVQTIDSSTNTIRSQRDVEDYSRLWIYLKGIQHMVNTSTQPGIKIGLKWVNTTGNPSITIFQAADTAAGSSDYLSSLTRAVQQSTAPYNQAIVNQAAGAVNPGSATSGQTIGTVNKNGTFVFPDSFWANFTDTNPKQYLLFEGVTEGQGQLVITFLKSDGVTEIGSGAGVWMDIRDIKEMYQRAIAAPQPANPVGIATPVPPNVVESPDTTGGTFVPDPNEDTKNPTYVVFVHGFNQSYLGSTNFAETMFKRIWQKGYKGRFASFRWPTYGNGPQNSEPLGTYNNSEYVAWHSGTALKQFVNSLPSGYAIDIAAHSMGNAVVGEALREGMKIQHYAMLHAATPACCYSNGIYTFPPLNASNPPVPDNDTDPGTSGLCYTHWLGNISGNPMNFYDVSDTVVGIVWETNNELFKPQPTLTGGYGYLGTNPVGQRLFFDSGPSPSFRYLRDQGEVKAYVDYSLTGAIGQRATTSNGSIASSNNDNGFGDEHSSEWVRNIQDPTLQTVYQTITGPGCFNLDVNP